MIENAKWITCEATDYVPAIKKVISIDGIKQAKIEITGLGYFSLFINGKRVTEDRFTPALTDYEQRDMKAWHYPIYDETTHRIYYLTYDISSFLKDGDNDIIVKLGPGFYYQNERICEAKSFGKTLRCAYALEIDDNSGSRIITTDGSEVWSKTDIVYSNMYIGEIIDKRVTENEWVSVEQIEAPKSILEEQTCTSDKIIRTITPKLIFSEGSKKIYDSIENITGWAVVESNGKPGDEIKLTFAEELNEDGQIDTNSTGSYYKTRSFPKQIQTDTFICGGGTSTFRPEFVWHGFRYIEVVGDITDIKVEVVHTDVEVTSSFKCDNEVINWLYDAYIRTQLDNIHGCIPSDCPHRERLGYTGDGQITAKTAMLSLDTKVMYQKWIQDILDCQDKITGHVQHTAPAMGGGGGPGGWGCAIIIVPDEYDKHYDDVDMLKRCYDSMKKWISYLKCHSVFGIVTREEEQGWCLGDWASIDKMELPEAYVNTCYMIDSLERMQRISKRVGHEEDVEMWKFYQDICKEAVKKQFKNEETGSFCDGIFGADAYAVWAGIDDDGRALKCLVERYTEKHMFDTGFLGTEILVDVLMNNGYEDLAAELLSGTELGSYGYMKATGISTIWEYFSGKASHNHPMLGAPVRHLFENILGIKQSSESVGYESIVISPVFPKTLNMASGSIRTNDGIISVLWERNKDSINLKVSLPKNKSAKLVVNGCEKLIVEESNITI